MKKKNHETQPTAAEKEAEPARREALKKIGKYGAYVAPAVLALIVSNRAEASCSLC